MVLSLQEDSQNCYAYGMKIGIDASRYTTETATGVEWYSYHIINGLISESLKHENTQVLLYSPHEINIPKELEHPKRVIKKILPAKRFWTLIKLSSEMRKNPPDVLFVPSHVLPLYRPNYSVITIHDTAFKYLRRSYSSHQYWYLNWSTKYAVRNAGKIIVPSEATKGDLIKLFNCPPSKIKVIYHGYKAPKKITVKEVPAHLKQFGFGHDNFPYIFFVGRLESKKNLSNLIKAFKIFSESKPEFRLVLAGKRGLGFDEIFKTVKKSDLMEKVIMPGYIEEDEKAYLYNNCSLFAFPSLYEGFGLPLLEAFSYGKPVLTSHVSCLPEIAKDAACYANPFDPEDIAHGLGKIVNDKAYAKKLVEAGKKRLEYFSWKKSVEQTFDVLTK